jgi:hypothetical protein
VLFGGVSAAGVVNDTWEWDGQAWTQQAETGPSPRWHHALGFDLVRNRVVFGCEADMTFCTAHVRFDPKRTLLFPKRTRFSNGR